MGPALFVHTSNRMEVLASLLAQVLRTPLSSPANAETIVVQSRGMERWASMQIAAKNGVLANCRFPFPRTVVDELAAELLPDHHIDRMYHPDCLGFAVHELLPELLDLDAFTPLRGYLEDDPEQLKRYQLACRIADLFDQYAVFRPDMLAAWTAGRDRHWQARLWRALEARADGLNRAELHRRLITSLVADNGHGTGLPERLSVFGISYLPPLYLEMLSALATRRPVHLFLMNPCREYWGDIFSKKEIARVMERTAPYSGDADALHLEAGHPLLASMGAMGRVFIEQIQSADAVFADAYTDSGGETLLERLQSDILTLEAPTPSDPDDPPRVRPAGEAAADRSLLIHACHSPLREIEVLHDQLLHLLEACPDIAPRDIIVMAPDISVYAPYIHAVFDAPRDRRMRIRYTVSDEPVSSASLVIRTFLKLVACRQHRMGVTDVMDLLACPAIRRRYGISDADVVLVEKWIRDTRIRWGTDEAARRALGVPGTDAHTWRHGIRRMLLGIAMPALDGAGIIADVLPYEAIEGADTRILGRFLTFLEGVLDLPAALQQDRSLSEWAIFLTGLVDRFFPVEDDPDGSQQLIVHCIAALGRTADRLDSDTTVNSRIMNDYLNRALASETVPGGFLAGGVSFCTLLPMRSIPAKAVCLLGMNHDAFPRRHRTMSIDLMAQSPRPGDRDRRKDDKYLFLEALISARRLFYVSYVGQSIIDNSPKPPSGLVGELLDTLRTIYGVDESDILIRHPLHAFSSAYYTGRENLFSYAPENCIDEASPPDRSEAPFFDAPYPPPPEKFRQLAPSDLERFIAHPAKFLLNARTGLELHAMPEGFSDREDHEIDGLARYRMGHDLVARMLSGASTVDPHRIYRLSGQLPPGLPGDMAFEEIRQQAVSLADRVNRFTGGREPTRLHADLKIGEFRLAGHLDHITDRGRVFYHFAAAGPRLLLRQWALHLVLNAAHPNGRSPVTRIVTADQDIELKPVTDATGLLRDLLGLYWQGLQTPLRLFPRTSYAYAFKRLRKGETPDRAQAAARSAWEGSAYAAGEGQDPYFELCYRAEDPLDSAFVSTAEAVFAPIMDHGGIL